MQFKKKQRKLMLLNQIYLGLILEAGEKYLKFIKEIKQNILKKRMFIIGRGVGMLTYLREKTFLLKNLL